LRLAKADILSDIIPDEIVRALLAEPGLEFKRAGETRGWFFV